MKKTSPSPATLIKRYLWLLPLLGAVWGVVYWAAISAVNGMANEKLVPKDQYIENQHTQDRRLDKLEDQNEKLDARLDELEKWKMQAEMKMEKKP